MWRYRVSIRMFDVGSDWLDEFNHDARRPFLLPSVNARLRMALILLSLVVDVGLGFDSLPDRSVDELLDDSEEDLLRFSSARMSSKETLRCGWVMGTSSRFSTKREAITVDIWRV